MTGYAYAEPSPFPPSFDGNPWAYGFGLFGDVVAAALALAMFLAIVLEARRQRHIVAMLGGAVQIVRPETWSPLFLYRTSQASFFLFVVMRTAPDALWMLAWGEVSEPWIRFWLAADLWCDGLALGPLMFAVACWAWGRQTIPQLLSVPNTGKRGRPGWDLIWRNGRIVIIVLIIAIGVTIGKASA